MPLSNSRPPCPTCHSQHIVKNGSTHDKKPKFQCQSCRRQFVEISNKKVISNETKTLINRLLLEKHSLAAIARTTKVSRTWIQNYVNQKYRQTPRQLQVSSKKKGN